MRKIHNSKFIIHNSQKGQALITLLFFMIIGVAIISSAALVLSAGILSSSTSEQGLAAYYVAESGAEDGILYLLRNPAYSGSLPPVPVGLGQASVSINNGTIISTGSYGTTVRKIQIQTTNSGGAFTISSWKEIN